jgi:hypothetical protein
MAVAKQVSRFEDRYKISSEDFFHRFSGGHMEDTAEFAEWSNAYQHFLSLRNILRETSLPCRMMLFSDFQAAIRLPVTRAGR